MEIAFSCGNIIHTRVKSALKVRLWDSVGCQEPDWSRGSVLLKTSTGVSDKVSVE